MKNPNALRMLRGTEMLRVDVTIVNNGDPIGGIGEVGVPFISPAVANAHLRLTGFRIKSPRFSPNAGGFGDG